MNTLNIYDQETKGSIKMVKRRKNSKFIKVSVDVDNYGFLVEIPKEQLEELLFK
jgi:hypothetical protein